MNIPTLHNCIPKRDFGFLQYIPREQTLIREPAAAEHTQLSDDLLKHGCLIPRPVGTTENLPALNRIQLIEVQSVIRKATEDSQSPLEIVSGSVSPRNLVSLKFQMVRPYLMQPTDRTSEIAPLIPIGSTKLEIISQKS